MENKKLIKIILDNLRVYIEPAIVGTMYNLEEIVGLVRREVGHKIAEQLREGMDIKTILVEMKGDYHDGKYHGYSPYQFDIGSYLPWINTGKWKNLQLATLKCIEVLEEKRRYLVSKGWDKELSPLMFRRAIFAAYNCGQGNVHKALSRGEDVDSRTYGKDYSKEVFEHAAVCKKILDAENGRFKAFMSSIMQKFKFNL